MRFSAFRAKKNRGPLFRFILSSGSASFDSPTRSKPLFFAIPDGEPVSTSPRIALVRRAPVQDERLAGGRALRLIVAGKRAEGRLEHDLGRADRPAPPELDHLPAPPETAEVDEHARGLPPPPRQSAVEPPAGGERAP